MKYLFILLMLTGCAIPRYVIIDNQKVDCNKSVKIWWGEKGELPTSKEVRELCMCNQWEIKVVE